MTDLRVKELMKLLERGVQSITDEKSFQKYLKVMARFPQYSARNNMLIYMQNPNATLVAGYRTWKTCFGRQVRKGEKGIRILAPYTYHVSETEKTKEHTQNSDTSVKTGFRSIVVFDVSQTEGRSLPSLQQPKLLEGEFRDLEKYIRILEDITGYVILRDDQQEGINGRCRYETRTIFYSSGLSTIHALKTIIHECTHALLHGPLFESESSRLSGPYLQELASNQSLREIEAEAVSYIVCQGLGIDSSEYSFRYIACWKLNNSFLQETLDRIGKASEFLLRHLSRSEMPRQETTAGFSGSFSSGAWTPCPVQQSELQAESE